MKWLIDPFRDKPTSISQSEYLSFGARYDNSDGSNRSGYPRNPRYHSYSVLFTLELTRYWSDTTAGTLAVSRPEHLRHHPPPPSFALDCQRRNRSAGVAARENHMERSFPRSGDGSYWHERCLTVADGKQLLRHKMVYRGAT